MPLGHNYETYNSREATKPSSKRFPNLHIASYKLELARGSLQPTVRGSIDLGVGYPVVQYRTLQGGWKEKKLSGNDKLSGLGDTRVNNCTVLIFNYLILFS